MTQEPVIVKKYANRRLYDTQRSEYVTLQDIREMITEDIDFKVVEAKGEKDITRSVLTQIIMDQESKEDSLLPKAFLRQIIRFYDDGSDQVAQVVPQYLNHAMEVLLENQQNFTEAMDEMTDNVSGATKAMFPFPGANTMMDSFQNIARQNMAFFNTAMQAFTPFPPVRDDMSKEEIIEKFNELQAENQRLREELKKN